MKEYDYSAKPISAWGYVGFSFLYAIPVIGWLVWLYNVLFAGNRNVKNHARSYFCMFLIGLLIVVVAAIVFVVLNLAGFIDAAKLADMGINLPF